MLVASFSYVIRRENHRNRRFNANRLRGGTKECGKNAGHRCTEATGCAELPPYRPQSEISCLIEISEVRIIYHLSEGV